MHTTIVMFALAGSLLPSAARTDPTWTSDYGAARQQGRSEEKPLAVFIGTGKAGWDSLSREGELDAAARKLLADRYICVYVDMGTKEGKALAASFWMQQGPGLVVSDRTGQTQAFWHEGDLSNREVSYYLTRYAGQGTDARYTERASYYRAPDQAAPGYHGGYGGFYQPSYQGGGGRGC